MASVAASVAKLTHPRSQTDRGSRERALCVSAPAAFPASSASLLLSSVRGERPIGYDRDVDRVRTPLLIPVDREAT